MRRTFISFVLVVALMLLALPVAATPGVGPASPGSSIVAKVLDAFVSLWRVVAPEVTASPAPEARAKDGDDRSGDEVPPLERVGCSVDPHG